ncbi:unnamed protein product [Effrenium voratum]|nr:unnamed protein product [Effrenium voratum]
MQTWAVAWHTHTRIGKHCVGKFQLYFRFVGCCAPVWLLFLEECQMACGASRCLPWFEQSTEPNQLGCSENFAANLTSFGLLLRQQQCSWPSRVLARFQLDPLPQASGSAATSQPSWFGLGTL